MLAYIVFAGIVLVYLATWSKMSPKRRLVVILAVGSLFILLACAPASGARVTDTGGGGGVDWNLGEVDDVTSLLSSLIN